MARPCSLLLLTAICTAALLAGVAVAPAPGPLSSPNVQTGILEFGINIGLRFGDCVSRTLPDNAQIAPEVKQQCLTSLLQSNVDLTSCCQVAKGSPDCLCPLLNQSSLISYWFDLDQTLFQQRVDGLCSFRGVDNVTSSCGYA